MSTFFIGYITLQVFCKGRNIAVNVSAQNNNGYKNEKKVLCLSFVVEIKREPERNHLSCVTVKTDHNEVSSVKMELHWNMEEFQWTLAYNSRFTRLPLRFVAASPLDSPPLFPSHFYHVLHHVLFCVTWRLVGRTNMPFLKIMVNMWVLILFYVTKHDLKKKHVYTYCLSTV